MEENYLSEVRHTQSLAAGYQSQGPIVVIIGTGVGEAGGTAAATPPGLLTDVHFAGKRCVNI